MTQYGLFANGELDQTCETEEDARKEAKDLKEMGIDDIKIYSVEGAFAAEALEQINDLFRMEKPFGRKGFKKLKESLGVTIEIIYQANIRF